MVNGNSFESERISVMEGSTQVLEGSKSILRMVPCPVSFMNQGALYWCFQLMYNFFKNSFEKEIKTLKKWATDSVGCWCQCVAYTLGSGSILDVVKTSDRPNSILPISP